MIYLNIHLLLLGQKLLDLGVNYKNVALYFVRDRGPKYYVNIRRIMEFLFERKFQKY